jgi:hypothetical protein
MNKDDLDQLLRESTMPERPGDYWRGFPGRVIGSLRKGAAIPGRGQSHGWLIGVALSAAACGLLLGFALWHSRLPSRDAYGSLRDGRVLREFLAQYPGRLQAIVQDESGLHAQLSDLADVSMSNPVLLEIRDGRDHRVIVTFSGQLVRCGDRNVMVLSDGGGQVMLVGPGFFWSGKIATGLAEKVQITAEQIPIAKARSTPSSTL